MVISRELLSNIRNKNLKLARSISSHVNHTYVPQAPLPVATDQEWRDNYRTQMHNFNMQATPAEVVSQPPTLPPNQQVGSRGSIFAFGGSHRGGQQQQSWAHYELPWMSYATGQQHESLHDGHSSSIRFSNDNPIMPYRN